MMNLEAAKRYARVTSENLDFQQGMLSLTSATGGTVEDVTAAFKQWVRRTPFPWRVALDYCRDRAVRGLPLPFTINE
jgi:hypothetical protein